MLQRYRSSLWAKTYRLLAQNYDSVLPLQPPLPEHCFAYFSASTNDLPLLVCAKWSDSFACRACHLLVFTSSQVPADFEKIQTGLDTLFRFLLKEEAIVTFNLHLSLPRNLLFSLQEFAASLNLQFRFLALSVQADSVLCELILDRMTYRGCQWGILSGPVGLVGIFGDSQTVQEIRFLSAETLLQAKGWLFDRYAYLTALAGIKGCRFEEEEAWQTLQKDDLPETLISAMQELSDYFAGLRKKLSFPISFVKGTAFQQKIWQLLEDIPWGATVTYLELAQIYLAQLHADKMASVNIAAARQLTRAVGAACGANPLPLRLPCHRVVGQRGKLVGYRGGIHVKETLLNHELWGY